MVRKSKEQKIEKCIVDLYNDYHGLEIEANYLLSLRVEDVVVGERWSMSRRCVGILLLGRLRDRYFALLELATYQGPSTQPCTLPRVVFVCRFFFVVIFPLLYSLGNQPSTPSLPSSIARHLT